MKLIKFLSEEIELQNIINNTETKIIEKHTSLILNHIEYFTEINRNIVIIPNNSISKTLSNTLNNYNLLISSYDPTNSSISAYKISISFISGNSLDFLFFDYEKAKKSYDDLLKEF